MVETTKVVWRKKEVTYGVDPVPTAAADAALTRNFRRKPLVVDRLARNLDAQQRGRRKDAPSNKRTTFSFELELAGSGDAGTAAPWMTDLQFCGMAAPTLTADTKAEQLFAAIGVAQSAGTFYTWVGTHRAKALGSRGTFGWDFTAGAYPFLKFDMTGLVPDEPVSDNTAAAPTLTAWQDPVEVNNENTSFLLDGHAAVLKSFTGDANATIALRNLVGARYVRRGNHAITGKLVIEAPDIATKNYIETLGDGSEIAIVLTHGIDEGNIVVFESARLQITDIEESEEDDVLMWTITYALNIGTTNDDLKITAK